MLSDAWRSICSTAHLLYVTGKGGVGKTTVAAALGLAAAARGRRTIVCEVAEQDRVSRAFAREGVRREQEVELAENLWAISIDPTAALQEWLGRQLGGPALQLITGSSAFQHFVAAAPGAKELITIAKVWELAQLERWDAHNRTYDLVDRRRARPPGTAWRCSRRRRRSARSPASARSGARRSRSATCSPTRARTGYVAVALPEEMPVNETLELGGAAARRGRPRARRDRRQRRLPRRASAAKEADELRAIARATAGRTERPRRRPVARRRPRRAGRARARPHAAHAPAAAQARGRRRPVHTLPFLFDAEVGLDEYRDARGQARPRPRLARRSLRRAPPRAAPAPAPGRAARARPP